MVGVVDAINWRKYDDTPIGGIEIEMAGWAWNEPIGRTPMQKQAIVRKFAQESYQGCMAAFRG